MKLTFAVKMKTMLCSCATFAQTEKTTLIRYNQSAFFLHHIWAKPKVALVSSGTQSGNLLISICVWPSLLICCILGFFVSFSMYNYTLLF